MSLIVRFYLNPVNPVSSTVVISSQATPTGKWFFIYYFLERHLKLFYQNRMFLDVTKGVGVKDSEWIKLLRVLNLANDWSFVKHTGGR